jgi:hypothetical protein
MTRLLVILACLGGAGPLLIQPAGSGGGGGELTDGDKGDVTVSSSGANWQIDPGAVGSSEIANGSVAYADMQNVSATDRILGRSTAGAGVVEELTCTPFARSILDDADAATVRATIGAIAGNQTITLSSDVTGSGTTAITATIAADAVGNTKLANMANATVKGRNTAGTGDPEDVTMAQLRALISAVSGSATDFLNGQGNFTTPASGGGGGILDTWHFQAESFDDADENWPVIANAVMRDSVSTPSVQTRNFIGASLTAAGGKFAMPSGSTSCVYKFVYQASAANGGTNNKVRWRLDFRALGTTGAMTSYTFADQTVANNTTMALFSDTQTHATTGLAAGSIYQFQLARVISGVTNCMTQDTYLSEFDITCN